MDQENQLYDALVLLEANLRRLDLWQSTAPSPQALSSVEPFAIDTLSPIQWLQWVFIPKMKELIACDSTLPSGFEMTPYFEQVLTNKEHVSELLPLIKQIDEAVK